MAIVFVWHFGLSKRCGSPPRGGMWRSVLLSLVSVFVRSSVGGLSDYFWCWATVNNASMNICMQVFLWMYLISLGWVGVWQVHIELCKKMPLFSKMAAPASDLGKFQFLHILATTCDCLSQWQPGGHHRLRLTEGISGGDSVILFIWKSAGGT